LSEWVVFLFSGVQSNETRVLFLTVWYLRIEGNGEKRKFLTFYALHSFFFLIQKLKNKRLNKKKKNREESYAEWFLSQAPVEPEWKYLDLNGFLLLLFLGI
jgi:hypothetical protein